MLDCYGTGAVNAFNNAGAFTQQGSGETRFRVFVTSVAFNNSGTVDVQAGILGLDGGGVLDFPGQSVLRGEVGARYARLGLAVLNLTLPTLALECRADGVPAGQSSLNSRRGRANAGQGPVKH